MLKAQIKKKKSGTAYRRVSKFLLHFHGEFEDDPDYAPGLVTFQIFAMRRDAFGQVFRFRVITIIFFSSSYLLTIANHGKLKQIYVKWKRFQLNKIFQRGHVFETELPSTFFEE